MTPEEHKMAIRSMSAAQFELGSLYVLFKRIRRNPDFRRRETEVQYQTMGILKPAGEE